MPAKRQVRSELRAPRERTERFLTSHPVFHLADLTRHLTTAKNGTAASERAKYHLATGRLKRIERGLYAAVPPGSDPARFQPDRYLVAAAARPEGILSHHAALELHGVAHSDWSVCTVLCAQRREPLRVGHTEIRFLAHPKTLARAHRETLGTQIIERMHHKLCTTGPERTLVEGFRQPDLVGGLEEHVESCAGFGVLDLDLLTRILSAFDQKMLWAAVGWFLEVHQKRFFVPDGFLAKLERRRPRSPHYLPRKQRGGRLVSRWNLVLPAGLLQGWEGHGARA